MFSEGALSKCEYCAACALVHLSPMEFQSLLDLLGEELANFGEFVTVSGPKLDMGAPLAHPDSSLTGAEMLGNKREYIADVHE